MTDCRRKKAALPSQMLAGVCQNPCMSEVTLEEHVAAAANGDAVALDSVVRAVKDDVYGLAIRMLWYPADAEDATQEILIRVVTGLATFEGRSSFRSWVYRVSVRALLNVKRGKVEGRTMSFEDFGEDLLVGLDSSLSNSMHDAERAVLKREVRIACTQAMLLCLDREHRIAYLLGEILELEGSEAAECMEVSAATYRKRLSRARERVNSFAKANCGLVSRGAACSCEGRISLAVRTGRIDPKRLLFATHPVREVNQPEVEAVIDTIAAVCDGPTLMRSNPDYRAPEALLKSITRVSSIRS